MPTKRGGISLIAWLGRSITECSKLSELIFFPSFCRLCSCLLQSPEEKIVCNSCLESIRPARTSVCLRCGRFFDSQLEDHLCSDCLHKLPPYSYHRSAGRYRGHLKDIILLYKYGKFKRLSKYLARFVGQSLGQDKKLWAGIEIIIPVPLHKKRYKERGFNQAALMAKELAKLKGIKFENRVLIKIKNTLPQTSLVAGPRASNVKGAFAIRHKEKIKGKSVILVDDVYTTGSTLKECSLTLLKGGVKEVKAVTIAQA